MKKLNHALNIIIGAFVGLLIGYAIYVVWDYNAHPQLYAAQSAPWYTGILLYGICALGVAVVCLVIKAVIRYKVQKAGNR